MYIDLQLEHTRVRVADRIQDGVVWAHQYARVRTWNFWQNPQDANDVHLHVFTEVDLFAALPDGTSGGSLLGGGVVAREVKLVADNDCGVWFNPFWEPTEKDKTDPRNGDVLYQKHPGESQADFEARLNAAPEFVTTQGRFFGNLTKYEIAIEPLLIRFMAKADQAPYYKYDYPARLDTPAELGIAAGVNFIGESAGPFLPEGPPPEPEPQPTRPSPVPTDDF